MSDWMEERITDAKTQEYLDYLDLFEFNGFNAPEFWFGDRVICFGHRLGTVLGLQWRDGIEVPVRGGTENAGWVYDVCYDGRQSLMGHRGEDLEPVDPVNLPEDLSGLRSCKP